MDIEDIQALDYLLSITVKLFEVYEKNNDLVERYDNFVQSWLDDSSLDTAMNYLPDIIMTLLESNDFEV
jgi:hypothetical protein